MTNNTSDTKRESESVGQHLQRVYGLGKRMSLAEGQIVFNFGIAHKTKLARLAKLRAI
jgi:hypothetical protein